MDVREAGVLGDAAPLSLLAEWRTNQTDLVRIGQAHRHSSPPTPVATLLLRATIAVTIREAGSARVGVMIPRCNDDGYLPPGIHPASLEEIAARFGQESELRQVQMQSLRWLIDVSRRAGVQRVVVNGSFVTDKLEPNDVDCVLLIGPGFPRDRAAEADLLAGLPFINLELVDRDAFQQFTEKTYATDRNLVPKGMPEVTP